MLNCFTSNSAFDSGMALGKWTYAQLLRQKSDLEDNPQSSIPLKRSPYISKPVNKKDATGESKFTRAVARIVRDGTLVHCYLACGHMLTMHKDEISAPSSMECWACEAEGKEH